MYNLYTHIHIYTQTKNQPHRLPPGPVLQQPARGALCPGARRPI